MTIDMKEKLAGVLVPVFALRHKDDLGIGDTQAMREAVQFCADNKIGVLQILPINETGGDNSPYNAISSMALDPVLLDMTPEAVPGLDKDQLSKMVTAEELKSLRTGSVNYAKVKKLKTDLLESAFSNFEKSDLLKNTALAKEFADFQKKNERWLDSFTLYRALIDTHHGNTAWPQWEESLQSYDKAQKAVQVKNNIVITNKRKFYAYVQWVAFKQWLAVKALADKLGIIIMGDIPFGVSRYSADVWAEQQLFDLQWCCGAPPEKFFQGDDFVRMWGQNWGMPLYDWKANEKENFRWWKQRVGGLVELFHAFRIDHVLGFFRVYAFPWIPERNWEFAELTEEQAKKKTGGLLPKFQARSDEEPEDAEKNCAQGEGILKVLQAATGSGAIVAEDLGMVPEYVRPLLKEMGIAGFSIPIFERNEEDRSFKPKEELPELSLATYGTHDHQPILTFYEALVKEWHSDNGEEGWKEVQRLMKFLGLDEEQPPTEFTPQLHETFMRALLETPCWLACLMITDLLGTAQRFNEPGMSGDYNWSQRLDLNTQDYAKDETYADKIKTFTRLIEETKRAPKVLTAQKGSR